MEKEFSENITLNETQVDKRSNAICNVCVLTPNSKNHRFYTDDALEDCKKLVDSTKCFINHGSGEIENLIGDFYGGEVRKGKVFSNLSLLESSHYKELILDIAENKPHLIGLSINGRGKFSNEADSEGREVCESILELRSVDLVGFPATTSGMFEGIDLKEVNRKLIIENEKLKKDVKFFRDAYMRARPTIHDHEDDMVAITVEQARKILNCINNESNW